MPKLTMSFKGHTLSVHYLEEGSLLIGREPDCAIQIESLAVSPRHAEVTTRKEQSSIRSLDGDNPVLVNNQPVEEADLAHGDVLQIGKHTLVYASDGVTMATVEAPEAGTTAGDGGGQAKSGRNSAYLQILSGEHIGRIIPLNRNLIRLGKAGSDCAMIVQRDGGLYLSYLEGHRPTVNGVPVQDESVLLIDGSEVQVGATQFVFYQEPAKHNQKAIP